MRALLLLILPGCVYLQPGGELAGRDPIEGLVIRDGDEEVPVTLYKSRHESFRALPSATGYLHTEDGRLLAWLQLEFEDLLLASQLGATSLPVGEPSEIAIRDTYGVGVSWVEHRRGADGERVFRQVYREGHGGSSSGALHIEDTDWTTFLVGRLHATLEHPSDGRRDLDLWLTWEDRD